MYCNVSLLIQNHWPIICLLQAVATRCCTTGRARSVSFIVFTDPCVAERVTMEKHTIDGRTFPWESRWSLNRWCNGPVPGP
ncbi:unnamed protein product [Brassica rapa subsp. narinosa]